MKFKIIFIIILTALSTLKVNSQTLANTKWFVTDGSTFNNYIIFKTDTVMVGPNVDNTVPISSFTESANNFTITDFTGSCLSKGTYTFVVVSDTLHFTLVSDLCVDRSQVFVSSTYHWTRKYTVGIADKDYTDLKIYPNPFTDKLYLNIDTYKPTEITLYDITSKKLLQETFTRSTSLNTEKLAVGIYIYELRNEKGIIRKGKIIKE